MKSRNIAAMLLLLSALAAQAATSDDMVIYSGRFHNGWGDSWSYIPHYTTNNPVHSGSNSMAFVPSQSWDTWWLKAGTSVDTTIYTDVSFWLNGGATGGQNIMVGGELDGTALSGVSVTAPTNSWKQVIVPLAALGISNKTNLSGLKFWNSTQPFFIDDLRLEAAPAPASVNVSVLASQTVRKVDGKIFGINQVGWDPNVDTPATAAILNDIGATCLRWPGGSWGDGWHWGENRGYGSTDADFIALAKSTHSDAFMIVNYGDGTPELAAYGVRMFNVTNLCNFTHWEVGNEVGGSWEWDHIAFFATNAIQNLDSFAAKIYTPTNAISWFIRTNLSGSTLVALTNYMINGNNATTLSSGLISDLNSANIVDRSSIYDASRFAGVSLRPETQTNLNFGLPALGHSLINRQLIEDSYPTELTRQTNFNLLPNAFVPHDAWTYAMRFTNYYAQMKAADPTIKVGAVADVFEDGTINYTHHFAVNPRTGVTNYGWTPVMLAYLRTNNCIPDFLIEHNYGPAAGDTQDLLYSRCWAFHAASLRQMLTDYLGDAGTNVTLEVTECGTGGDRQGNSLPGGLFYADSIGQILQTEFKSRLWWDLRNGIGTVTDSDPEFYGWRTNANGSVLGDGGIVYGLGGVGSAYPTYYCAKLMPRFAADGDTVVRATSDNLLLTTYAVRRTNGALTLLVINKSCSANLTANFNLSGYVPYTNATVYRYGIPQDDAARTGIGSPDIEQTNLTGIQSSFSAAFAPFSATVMVLSPDGTTPPDMKALYAFEGNALDTSGSGNHGTATAVSYVAGKVGSQAAQFNGTNSYVSIPRAVQDDFTVAMWVKTTDNGGWAGAQWWAGKGLVDGEVGGGGADWGTALVDGKFVLGVGSVSGDTTLASSVNINDGAWHHVAAARNNTSGAMAVYVDGVLRGSGTGPTGSRTFPSGLRIGSLQTGNNFLNGTLDDVRLYDRILTVGEIAGLVAPPAAPTNLVATIGDASVVLSWSASSNATSYFVKRSTVSGGGYTAIATNTSLICTNAGLTNGALYYFVVSALDTFGESTNSTQVSARPTSPAPVVVGVTNAPGQLKISWLGDHTGWRLQSQTSNLAGGLGTNWVNVSSSTETNQVTMPVNTTNGAVFFRLVRPY
jgi:hypothetical protein